MRLLPMIIFGVLIVIGIASYIFFRTKWAVDERRADRKRMAASLARKATE